MYGSRLTWAPPVCSSAASMDVPVTLYSNVCSKAGHVQVKYMDLLPEDYYSGVVFVYLL